MNPSDTRFTAKPALLCKGCLFEYAHSSVCHQATATAIQRGLPDCDTFFIYVLDKTDERQIDLFKTTGESHE